MIQKISEIKKFILKQIADIRAGGIKELFRKFYLLIKIFANFPGYLIAVVACIVIRLIRPWLIIRIDQFPGSLGGSMYYTAIYYCKKKLKIDQLKRKHLDLLYILYKGRYVNKQVVKMWKRKLNFLPSYFLHPISCVNKLIPGWKIHTITNLSHTMEKDVDNLVEKYPPINFTEDEEIYGKEILNKFGLKDGNKFVCLAVRDNAHQLKQISSKFRDWSYHDYRNYDINNFILAAEELTRRGYYVFRMGVFVEKPFNLNNPKVIDYANSKLRSDFMDVYLGAKCSFCLSTSFGFDGIPYIFRRPIAIMCLPFGDLPTFSEKFLILTKHHMLKDEKRELSLTEIFSHGVAYAFDTKVFKQQGIELINNTPEEIRDLAMEMYENLENGKKLSHEDEELQNTFKRLYYSSLKRFDHRKGIKFLHEKEVVLYKDYYKLHGQIKSRFSTKFLRDNKNWLR